MKTAYEQGVEWGSCAEALEMRKAYATQADWWKACNRGDWLLWQVEKAGISYDIYQPAIEKIVLRAVREHCVVCGVPVIEKWAKRYMKGAVREAGRAIRKSGKWAAEEARAARAAGCMEAARAARAAAMVARVVAKRAEDEELRLQAEDIHSVIPEWIW